MKFVDRRGSYSVKYDDLKSRFVRDDLIPLWVADMDFKTPICVRNAFKKIINQGVYGYNIIPDGYYESIKKWLKNVQGWDVESNWITFIPGIIKGIGYVINFFTDIDDVIVVQPPVYPPFISVPSGNNRKVLYNPLVPKSNGSYKMDFYSLENIFSSNNCKLFILSNPHNPGGIAWNRDTLARLAELCYKYNVLVIADEIHADMPLWGHKHIPFASVSDKASAVSITFGAPSKTFNMAWIVSSYAIIPSLLIRKPFYKWLQVNELNSPTIFATIGAMTAYNMANQWRLRMLKYIEGNAKFVEKACSNINSLLGLSLIRPLMPESSFLIWLDCKGLTSYLVAKYKNDLIKFDGDLQKILVDFFINRAKLALNDGSTFGPGGEGYMRLNIGTSRDILVASMNRISEALSHD